MKNSNFLIIILSILLIFSCNSDNEQINDVEEQIVPINKILNKTKIIRDNEVDATTEYFYSDDSRIQSIVRNSEYFTKNISINYSNDIITDIVFTTVNNDPNFPDLITNYDNITMTDNSINLVSTDIDLTLEINHTNGYVTSTSSYSDSDSNNPNQWESFTRNGENQLTSSSINGNIFYYSNFDAEKKNDPSNSVIKMSVSNLYLFKIFNLKVTADNPLTAIIDGETLNSFLEYDNDGYVIKSRTQPNSTNVFASHEYIEQ